MVHPDVAETRFLPLQLKQNGLSRATLLKKAQGKLKSGHLMQGYHLKALLESFGCTTQTS
eukprot:SAG31_NODE_10667_length_1112_cov_0.925962_3_plen_59_part_01